jgi:hypothetical protein
MYERTTGDSTMNERKTVDTMANSKRLWTAPVLKAIVLNSARHTTGAQIHDGTSVHAIS